MERHRRKDLEADGPGCSILDTRKRSWKAPDGSVVEKRPCILCQRKHSRYLLLNHLSRLNTLSSTYQIQNTGPTRNNWCQDYGLPLDLDSVPQIEYAFQPALAQQTIGLKLSRLGPIQLTPALILTFSLGLCWMSHN